MWFTVAQTAIPNIFLSWPWIDSWLSLLEDKNDIYVITASNKEQLVGIGIFVEKHVKRHGFIKSKQWYLHRTGDETLDQIWTEKNDFLVNTLDQSQIKSAMWQHLFLNQSDVDEFIVDVALEKTSSAIISQQTGYQLLKENSDVGYVVALDTIKNIAKFPQELSTSTYKHLEKTLRRLTPSDNLKFEFVTDPQNILDILQQHSQWHIRKWEDTPTPSGFNNAKFQQFHKHFITQDQNNTCLAVLSVDDEIIGLNYYLRNKDSIAFYLSCIRPVADNKIKIGLTLHCLTARQAHILGISYIDFLAGDAEYKRKLSNNIESYCKFIIQKQNLKFKLETSLAKLKRTILGILK